MEEQNPSKRTVEAEEFVLKGADGKTLATFGSDKHGSATIQLFDSNGVGRCIIGLAPDGKPIIAFADAHETPLLALYDSEDSTAIVIRDKNNSVRARIIAGGPDDKTAISLGGPSGQTQVIVSVGKDGMASVVLQDAKDSPVIGIMADPEGEPAIVTEDMGNILKAFESN